MEPDQGPHRIPLPTEQAATGVWRDKGVRGARHLSNWTVAALVVGVGTTTAVLAHSAQSGQSANTNPTAGTVSGTSPGVRTQGGAGGAPTLHSPVALTTPSGVVIQSGTTGGVAGSAGTAPAGSRRVVYGGDT